jgi:hypothetical protein
LRRLFHGKPGNFSAPAQRQHLLLSNYHIGLKTTNLKIFFLKSQKAACLSVNRLRQRGQSSAAVRKRSIRPESVSVRKRCRCKAATMLMIHMVYQQVANAADAPLSDAPQGGGVNQGNTGKS